MIESSIACVLRRRKGREHPAGVSAPATARSRLAGGLSSAFVPLCYKNARFVSSGLSGDNDFGQIQAPRPNP